METKLKYTDEPGADKGVVHLMITRMCDNPCPLCCNKQYDLDTVPVVTVEELKAAHTVMLTGGEPFYLRSILVFCIRLRLNYPNVKQLYIYTSGFQMFVNDGIEGYTTQFSANVDGINFSPKRRADYVAIKKMLTNKNLVFNFFANTRSNRIILMPNNFMTRKEQEEYIESLPLKSLACEGAKFEVEYREWQKEFKPNGGVWRRLPVFL